MLCIKIHSICSCGGDGRACGGPGCACGVCPHYRCHHYSSGHSDGHLEEEQGLYHVLGQFRDYIVFGGVIILLGSFIYTELEFTCLSALPWLPGFVYSLLSCYGGLVVRASAMYAGG